MADGLSGRACRAFVWRRDGDRCGGAVVLRRWLPLHWAAHVVVLDPDAAPELGRLIDRSSARVLQGFERDVEALRPHLSRWRSAISFRAAAVPPGFTWTDPPKSTRPAVAGDVPRITELAWQFAPHSIRWRPVLARRVRAAVREGAVVVERGDPPVVVGYGALDTRTPEYDHWAHVVVDPAYRGEGLSWDLVAAGAALTRARGAGGLVSLLPTNPMTMPDGALMPEALTVVSLEPRVGPLRGLLIRSGGGRLRLRRRVP